MILEIYFGWCSGEEDGMAAVQMLMSYEEQESLRLSTNNSLAAMRDFRGITEGTPVKSARCTLPRQGHG